MIKRSNYRLRAIRCVLDVYRWDVLGAFVAYRQWAKGRKHLYDEMGYIL